MGLLSIDLHAPHIYEQLKKWGSAHQTSPLFSKQMAVRKPVYKADVFKDIFGLIFKSWPEN